MDIFYLIGRISAFNISLHVHVPAETLFLQLLNITLKSLVSFSFSKQLETILECVTTSVDEDLFKQTRYSNLTGESTMQ